MMRSAGWQVRWLILIAVTLVLSWVALGHRGPTDEAVPIIEPVPFADYPGAVKCLLTRCPGSSAAASILLIDGLGNVVVFIPFGASVGLAVARTASTRGKLVRIAAAAGLMLSAGFEIAQLAIPGRVVAIADLMTNTLGAWIGGVLAAQALFATGELSE